MTTSQRRKMSEGMKASWARRRAAKREAYAKATAVAANQTNSVVRYVPDDEVTALTDILRKLEGNEELAKRLSMIALAIVSESKDSTTMPPAARSTEW
jgi:hypothetical protein